jgi:hypothetical protein
MVKFPNSLNDPSTGLVSDQVTEIDFAPGGIDAALISLARAAPPGWEARSYSIQFPLPLTPALIRGYGGLPTDPGPIPLQQGYFGVIVRSPNDGFPLPGGPGNYIFTAAPYSRTQGGDSGGPLTVGGIICGVHSGTNTFTGIPGYAYAASTSPIASWIASTTGRQPLFGADV